MSARFTKIHYKSLTCQNSKIAKNGGFICPKVWGPRARSNQVSLFLDLLPISDLIGGAGGAAPEFGKFWKLPWRLELAGTVEAGRGGQG